MEGIHEAIPAYAKVASDAQLVVGLLGCHCSLAALADVQV